MKIWKVSSNHSGSSVVKAIVAVAETQERALQFFYDVAELCMGDNIKGDCYREKCEPDDCYSNVNYHNIKVEVSEITPDCERVVLESVTCC